MDKLSYKYVHKLSEECINAYSRIMKQAQNPKIKIINDNISTKEFLKNTADNMYYGHINENLLLKNWKEIIEISESYNL